MVIDHKLESRLRRLASEPAPMSGALEDRVMSAIALAAASRGRRPGVSALELAAVAAALIAALMIGALIGWRLSLSSAAIPAGSPSRDPSVVRFRAVIDSDARAIDRYYVQSCNTRASCDSNLTELRSGVEKLLADIGATPVPAQLVSSVSRLRATAQHLLGQLDAAITVVETPGSSYAAAAGSPDVSALDLATAVVDCWPASPIQSDHGDWSCA